MSGPCGDASEWPYICNPNGAGGDGREYPYCEFETVMGDTICAKDDGQQVEFVDKNGDPLSCSCFYFNAALGPQANCREWKLPTDSPTKSPTVIIDIDIGSSESPSTTTAPTVVVSGDLGRDASDATKTQSSESEVFSLALSQTQLILVSVALSIGLMICAFLSIFYMKAQRKTNEED
jgi:hypothetical protein